jgi:hypothetical protein
MNAADTGGEPEWDEVRTLFGGYLHQDFPEDYGGPWEAVRQYCADSSAADMTLAANQIKEILERFPDEKQLSDVSDRLGSEYYPPGVGQTYRDWFVELERFLRESATTS